MNQHEMYLKGQPLTPELSELAAGIESATAGPRLAPPQSPQPPTGALTDDDREWLSKLRNHPGWEIYLKLLDSLVHKAEREAVALSQIDPVGNGAEIARLWTYLKSWKEIRLASEQAVNAEVQRHLGNQAAPKGTQ